MSCKAVEKTNMVKVNRRELIDYLARLDHDDIAFGDVTFFEDDELGNRKTETALCLKLPDDYIPLTDIPYINKNAANVGSVLPKPEPMEAF